MITIKDVRGSVILDLDIYDGCKRRFSLMKEDCIILKFSLARSVVFGIGSYAEIEGFGRFEVTDIYKPKRNQKTGGWDYELQLNAHYWKWKNKIFKYTPETSGNEAAWSLTAPLTVQMSVFLRNLESLGYTYNGEPYEPDIDATVSSDAKAMTYDNQSLLDALFSMAQTWETDVWVTDKVIHFGKCIHGDAVNFVIDENVEEMSPEETRQTYATRLYAFGSERNIPTGYRPIASNVTVNGIVQKRLMLPTGTPYIDAFPGMATDEIIEQVVVFDDIYPRVTSTMSNVDTKEYPYVDENGNPTGQTWNAYRYKDSSMVFSEDYILPGTELQIVFESGALSGMTFAVKFNPEGKSESDPSCQLWEIVRNEDYGRPLPDETLKPKNGDAFVLTGWDSTKIESLNLVANAEQELLAKAQRLMEELKLDPISYRCKMVSSEMFDGLTPITYNAGQCVSLHNADYFPEGTRESRIIGFEIDLAQPFKSPVYIVGEKSAYSRIRDLEGKVDVLTMKGQTFTGTGTGSNVYLIKSTDTTPASDSNAYSALRSRREFLSRIADDIASGHISFAEGMTSIGNAFFKKGAEFGGVYVHDLYAGRGAGIDRNGNAEFESVRVRTYFEALELIVNRLSAIEGDQLLTEADTIDSVDDLGVGGGGLHCYGLHLRSKWDGYFTAQAQGNVLKGIINTLAQNAVINANTGSALNQQGTDTAPNYYTSWMRVNSVSPANNYIEVTLYPGGDCPAGVNFPPCAMMKIARWGNQFDTSKQSCLYLSSTEGRIIKLTGVTKPILDHWNYGATFGTLPEFLYDYLYAKGHNVSPTQDYVYAKGIIYQDLIHVDYMGKPVITYVDRGEFVLGTDYYFEAYNPNTGLYETDDVWYMGCKWRCCKNLNQTIPAWNNTDWVMIEGNPSFTVRFAEPEQLYDLDNFNATLTIVAMLYNMDVTADILDADVQWIRYTEDNSGNPRASEDLVWNTTHQMTGKTLNLTLADLDMPGYLPKRIQFTVYVTLRDGMNNPTVTSSTTIEF